jgi:hypothetical protein
MMQILGISAFAKTPINELFTKQQIKQNVKEQLNLFSYNELLTHRKRPGASIFFLRSPRFIFARAEVCAVG